MLLHFGNKPTLVVSSPDAPREILQTHDVIFSNRPDSSFARQLLYNHKDIVFAPYGEYWRQVRRIFVLQLLSTKRVQSLQQVREEEVKEMMENIQRSCSNLPSFSALVDLSEVLMSLTNDITSRVALGKKYGGEEGSGRRLRKMFTELGYLLGIFNVGDFIPWLGWVNYVIGLEERVEKNFAEIDSFIDEVIEDHIHGKRREYVGNYDADGGGKDFVDFLLRMQQDKSAEITLGIEHIKAIVLGMFSAGTETSHSLLESTMARLLKHPEFMEEIQKEVRAVAFAAGRENIKEDDIEQMHYLKAVIKETLRLHPPIPLFQHESTEEAKLKGYDIPAKTTVIINAWAIGRDPTSWIDPEEFKPKRFFNDASSIDFKGRDFQLIPFGAGRRGCPGTHFAIAVVELALANLLHKFDWALPNGAHGEALDITEAPGISSHLKSPLLAVATPHY
ncbi:cytochrome P450 736A117-like [Telopea speciosissima]|uniref:cytochrome P450 736A117-like n=1 Tax=Telopea speciosissima TaxID=54955 RepID=UPI001CC50C31|nr:cytochrome P450 736A117-like [Telopea speciosissima]XP_043690190.1 cytochrome P450 736A117-like [Telopea speciosissima]